MASTVTAGRPAASRVGVAHGFAAVPWERLFPAAFLLTVAVTSRAHVIGNPVIQIDEQWYLLVGRRMLDGAIPFVDIFDRKPIGLFLLFAAIRSLGGTGVVAYQVAALVSAWLTSLVVHRMASAVSTQGGALAAGALYLLCLTIAGGEGGQSPVFYNLPVALSALIVWRASVTSSSGTSLRISGAAALLLMGVAMQIKYTVVFEGVFLGIVLVATEWARRRSVAALFASASLWVIAALAPTIAAAGAYWWLGHLPEWTFANVTSIASRGSESPEMQRHRIRVMVAMLAPIVATVPLRRWLGARPGPDAREDIRFVDLWAGSALLGVVVFGTWYDHYALPLFVPFSVAAAPLATRRSGGICLAALLCLAGIRGQWLMSEHDRTRGNAETFDRLIAASGKFSGCPLVYEALPAFYDRTDACLPTTRAFPGHLNQLNEVGATGIDEPGEVARIMGTRPSRIVLVEPALREENLSSRAALYGGMRGQYTVVYRLLLKPPKPHGSSGRQSGPQWLVVYGRRSRNTSLGGRSL